ncbi:MAG TPA: N-6 DNA methylase, partial [Thermomicrobiales bacterium]|nr:N-6 DNA methylase [Thermomicrobiales bacterium]
MARNTTTVRIEGAVLPPDLLQRVARGDSTLPGMRPEDYHLVAGERFNEGIARAWNRVLGIWTAFRPSLDGRPAGESLTTLTRERWLLPLFDVLGYGRLQTARAIDINGASYAVSHAWGSAPIHLVAANIELDRKTAGVAGAARMSPHGMLQELLNRSDDRLWGVVSNGLRLRILRDSARLTRQAFVEFDLQEMMDGEVYADFALLWMLVHQSRIEGERPEDCWLERWSREAIQQGTRALDHLRGGVEKSIATLGAGFLGHAANTALREALRSGELDKQDYYRQLLRTVYRLLFLFVAEDRGVLLDPRADEAARERYSAWYSTQRLRRLAQRRRGTRHADLWQGLRLIIERLGSDTGEPGLALPALGSGLWAQASTAAINGCELSNRDLLDAVRALAFIEEGNARRVVDYRNLGSEELGSVYESLLELHPQVGIDTSSFSLATAGGNERKTTGSYYTPSSLIAELLDSALDPVIEDRLREARPDATAREDALLNLKVVDPAAGSGHFLVAAAHRIAKRLAAVRTGEDEPSPEETRAALRAVIGRCVYGVDINPMAVELCKVSLWLEAMEPGKPLSFLDHHIQCGNSLLGATPALLEGGIPDEAFTAITGDDKKYVSEWKKRNREQRKGQLSFDHALARAPWERLGNFAAAVQSIERIEDATIAGVRQKQQVWEETLRSSGYAYSKLWADAWCAAFVWKKTREWSH